MTYGGLFGSATNLSRENTRDGTVPEKEFDELKSAVQQESSTTVVVAPVPVAEGPPTKKRATVSQKNRSLNDVVAPPIALPNPILPGNGLKNAQQGKERTTAHVMRVLYDDAHALMDVLRAMEKFTPYLHLVFDESGLELQVLHSTRTLNIMLRVPRTSFVCYDNLIETAVCPVLSSKAVKEVAGGAESNQSVSFLYHQSGRDDEPLHVQLHPRDGDSATALAMSYRLANCEDEDKVELVPDLTYQYQITFNARQFYGAVKRLAAVGNTLVLMLRSDAKNELCFEMGVASETTFSTTSIRFGHSTEPSPVQCTIVRLAPKARESNTDYFLNHRVLAVLLESIALFGSTAPANTVVLRLGVKMDPGNGYNELPLHFHFPMRPQTQAPFTLDAYIATKIATV